MVLDKKLNSAPEQQHPAQTCKPGAGSQQPSVNVTEIYAKDLSNDYPAPQNFGDQQGDLPGFVKFLGATRPELK